MNQINLRLNSRKLMQKNSVCVLMPEAPRGADPGAFYDRSKEYALLLLLHGGTCDYEDYLMHDHIVGMLEGKEVLVVMPNGLNSDFANHMEFGTGFAFADYIVEELLPFIRRTFPVSKKKEDTYIAGYSMGGAAALMLGLYRPELFGHVGVLGSSVRESAFLEPCMDWSGEEFRVRAAEDPTAFPTEFGDPRYGITKKEINMIARYPKIRDYVDSMECTWERFTDNAKTGNLQDILFCCGDQDTCCEKVKQFRIYAEKLGADSVHYCFIEGFAHDRGDVTIRKALEYFGL